MDFDFEKGEGMNNDNTPEKKDDFFMFEDKSDEQNGSFDISSSTDDYDDYDDDDEEFEDISSNSNPPHGHSKPRNVKRIVLNSVISVFLAVSVIITSLMGWYVGSADTELLNNPLLKWLFGGDTSQAQSEAGDFEELKISDNTDVTYFLVVGCDWTSSKQTDVMVVVCMDHKNETVSMLQIPRDTYVNTVNGGNRINSVFPNAREGELPINALRRCLSDQLQIPIDHYILFTIEGAVRVVDAIGGVEMNLPTAIRVEDPLNFGKYYNIGPGKVKLSGKDAIGFMRKRYGNEEGYNGDGSDINRVKQQRKFYSALFNELLKMSNGEIFKIANGCFSQIQTDLTLNETAAYALSAKGLDKKNIHIFGLPGQACSYNGVSYYSIHRDDYADMFNKYFNPYGDPITVDSVNCPDLYLMAGHTKNDYWMPTEDSTLNDY